MEAGDAPGQAVELVRCHNSDVCAFCGEGIGLRCSTADGAQCKLRCLSEDLCVVAEALERIADAAPLSKPSAPTEHLYVAAGAAQRIVDAAARIHQFAIPSESGEAVSLIDVADARLRNGKVSRRIVDALHIRTMVAAYHHYFAIYSKYRKGVNQLIPGKVWKLVYARYKKAFPLSPFQEETLKDRLRETLKDLKANNLKRGATPEKAPLLLIEDVLVPSRSPDGGDANRTAEQVALSRSPDGEKASRTNALKRTHSLIDGTTAPLLSSSSASSTDRSEDACPAAGPAESMSPLGSSAKPTLETQQMQPQQDATHTVVENHFQESTQKQNALLDAKLDRQKIANLKSARDVGVITETEFKDRVRKILMM